MNGPNDSFSAFLNAEIVLDTAGPVTYLGTLEALEPDGLWLRDADIRDRNEGHVSKERYIAEARRDGIIANRRRIFVRRDVILSCSRLEDVMGE